MTDAERTNKEHPKKNKPWFLKAYSVMHNFLRSEYKKINRTNQMIEETYQMIEDTYQMLEEVTKPGGLADRLKSADDLIGISFEKAGRKKILNQATTLAFARYGSYIDKRFKEKSDTQKDHISSVIHKNPFDVLILSYIAEQNQEKHPLYIQNANDLEAKLNSPQIQELSQEFSQDMSRGFSLSYFNECLEKIKIKAKSITLSGQNSNSDANIKTASAGRYA